MRKYIIMQIKRLLRQLPLVLCVMAVLFASLALALSAFQSQTEGSQQQTRFRLAMVGTAGDGFLELGLTALQTLDSSRMAIDLEAMEEQAALDALRRGDVAAIVVFPEGFTDEIMRGNVIPLRFISAAGAASIVSMVKEELTDVISYIVIEAQKGIYGAGNAVDEAGGSWGKTVNDISIAYAEFVFDRGKLYSVTELGIADGLSMGDALLCGLSIVFLMLLCLPFAPLYVRKDPALAQILSARKGLLLRQVICEFACYAAALILMGGLAGLLLKEHFDTLVAALPAVVMIAAFSYLICEVSEDLISAVLLQFGAAVGMCFVSGCLYPATFFPETVQRLGNILPTGLARQQLAGCMTGKTSLISALGLLGYSLAFLALAGLARYRKLRGKRG